MKHSRKKEILGSGKWKQVRLRVLARDGWQCTYCGTHLDNTNAQVDHVIPLAKDSSDPFNMEGLVAACRRCNLQKGDRNNFGVFLGTVPTPPVFLGSSLPETTVTQPSSPFSSPSQAI
jgi:5-methylcytosine-specific restriction endonuclease McrA